jgi:acetyl esterase
MASSSLLDAATRVGARGLFALPDPLLRLIAGPLPEHAAGLAPDAWLVAQLSERLRAPAGDLPVVEMRERFVRSTAPLSVRPSLPMATSDLTLTGAPAGGPQPARLYVPGAAPAPGPLLVYYHGGGWVQGSVATHDAACRLLSHLSGVRLLSIDYRLAPEHPFPAAANDALAAYIQAADRHEELGADPTRLAVGGDSAGGNLAAVTAQAARDDPSLPDPAFQLLLYPALDFTVKRESRLAFGERFLLTEHNMTWYEDQYVPDHARRSDPRASPLLAPNLAGLAPAYIATSLADPLRDEGELYAQLLRDAGVPVALQRHPLIHGFVNQTVTRSARQALAVVAGALRQGLA